MARELSDNLLSQMNSESSIDPFLALITLSHESFDTLYLVNNTESIVSRGNTYNPFPVKVKLPTDDGETQREVSLVLDNVSLELIEEIRTPTTPIECKVEMILASNPDIVEISYDELKIKNVSYTKQNISAKLYLDDFLDTELTSEKYTPTSFPGIF